MYPTPSSSGYKKRKLSYDRGSYKPRKLFKSGKKRKTPRYKGKYKGSKKNKSLSGSSLRKKRVSSLERFGVHVDFEKYSSIQTAGGDGQNVIIGHTSHSALQGYFVLATAMTKALATKMGISISSFSQIIEGYNTGDSVSFRYQPSTSSGVSIISMASPGATMTWIQVRDWLDTSLKAIPRYSELVDFIYVPASSAINRYSVVNLQAARVEFYSKSLLKLQNVSVPVDALDDTSDEVDAVALVGKTFVGKGLGTALIRPASAFSSDIGLWADAESVISRVTDGTSNQIYEVPRAEELLNCKKSGKIVFPAGNIQSSELKVQFKGYFNTFFRMLSDAYVDVVNAPTTWKNYKFGKFAIHCLQKAIETAGAGAININFELDVNYDCVVYPRNPIVTTQAVVINAAQKNPVL